MRVFICVSRRPRMSEMTNSVYLNGCGLRSEQNVLASGGENPDCDLKNVGSSAHDTI